MINSSCQPIRRVALIYDAKLPYDVKIVEGVAQYVQKVRNWNIYIRENALHDQRLPELHTWKGDGIIADFDDPRVAHQIQKAKIPAVGFGSGYGWYDPSSGIPYFFSDNRAVARLAAEHLKDCGFRRFAFYGYVENRTNGWSDEREVAFAECVKAAGGKFWSCRRGRAWTIRWNSLQEQLHRWLETLCKPIGILAANDKLARQLLEVCHTSGVRVPEDVAVVSVDNDEMLCQLCSPPLSSIELGCRRIGYLAAALLDRMMSGQPPTRHKYVIPPEKIVIRRSSDVVAVEDSEVAAALTFIRNHMHRSFRVSEVVAAVSVSRSNLERRFKSLTGRTIREEIGRVRLQNVQQLISTTHLPLKQIAVQSGFRTVQHMTDAFGQHLGITPAAYRAKSLDLSSS